MTRDLTPRQVADRLELSAQTVRKLLQRGDLNSYRVGTGPRARWRITEEALAAFRNPNQQRN